MNQSPDPIPYARPQLGWLTRHKSDAGTRMLAFAMLALAGVGCRYLTTYVIGNSDLLDAGKYVLLISCAGFCFEYIVSLIG